MGKEEEEGPLPRAEQLLPDSKKYPPHRVDRRWKEKKKRTEKFRLAFWRTHHVGQLRSTSSVMISSICGWEKEEDWEMDDGGGQQVKGADSEWMNEHFATPFFLSDFNNILSLSFFFEWPNFDFLFSWGGMRVDLNMRTETPHNPKRNGQKRNGRRRVD